MSINPSFDWFTKANNRHPHVYLLKDSVLFLGRQIQMALLTLDEFGRLFLELLLLLLRVKKKNNNKKIEEREFAVNFAEQMAAARTLAPPMCSLRKCSRGPIN